MKKFTLLIITFCFLHYSSAEAGIRFIMDTDAAIRGGDSSLSGSIPDNTESKEQCIEQGYNKTSCSEGFFLADSCPYAPEYYANCCPDEYKYTREECISQNKPIGTYSCGGYYKCSD